MIEKLRKKYYFNSKKLNIFYFYLIVFIIFFIILYSFKENAPRWKNEKPVFGWDTPSYLTASIRDPWNSLKTPGLLWYYKILNADAPLRELNEEVWPNIPKDKFISTMDQRINNDASLKSIARRLHMANCALLALGCAFLAYAISEVLRPTAVPWISRMIIVFLAGVSMTKGYLPPLTSMYADSVVAILAAFTLGFLLLFFRFRKFRWLCAACAAAFYASLVKPAFYFLPLICGVVCAWLLIKNLYQKQKQAALKAFAIGLILSVCTLAWPAWLWVKGGLALPSQLSGIHNYVIAYFLAKPGDENLAVNANSKLIIKKILEQKPEIIKLVKKKKIKYSKDSLTELYSYYINAFNYIPYNHRRKIWNELELPLDNLSVAKQVYDFAPKIIEAHKGEYLRLLLANFMAGFNQCLPQRQSYAWWISEHYPLTLLIIGVSLIFGLKSLRLPIILCVSIHMLNIAFCSFGGIVGERYMESTEFLMLFGFLLALLSMFWRLCGITYKYYEKTRLSKQTIQKCI